MQTVRNSDQKVNTTIGLGMAAAVPVQVSAFCHLRQCHIEQLRECVKCFRSSESLRGSYRFWRSCVDLNISTHPADLPPTLQPHAIVGAAIERAELIGSVHPVRRLLEAHAEPYLTSLVIRSLLNAGHREWALELCQLRELDLHKLLDAQNRAYWATHGEEEGQARCMTVTFAGRGEVENRSLPLMILQRSRVF